MRLYVNKDEEKEEEDEEDKEEGEEEEYRPSFCAATLHILNTYFIFNIY